jgi:hypothetical protein
VLGSSADCLRFTPALAQTCENCHSTALSTEDPSDSYHHLTREIHVADRDPGRNQNRNRDSQRYLKTDDPRDLRSEYVFSNFQVVHSMFKTLNLVS